MFPEGHFLQYRKITTCILKKVIKVTNYKGYIWRLHEPCIEFKYSDMERVFLKKK